MARKVLCPICKRWYDPRYTHACPKDPEPTG